MLPVVLLTVGIGWVAPYWLALTYGYQSVRERAVTWTALALLLLGAPISSQFATWARTTTNPLYHAALSSTTGRFDVEDVILLREAARQNPSDRDLQFLIATQFKNLGDYELAAMQYNRILQSSPDDLDAKMNLGNIRFAQQDWDGALRYYDEVLASNPDPRHDALQQEPRPRRELPVRRTGGSLGPRRNGSMGPRSRLMRTRTGDFRVVYDRKLDSGEILAKFHGLRERSPRGAPTHPARHADGLVPAVRLRTARARGVLILLLELIFRDRKLTQRCWKCSSAFCGRCQIGTGRKGLCTQCYHLFIMKDGVSVRSEERAARSGAACDDDSRAGVPPSLDRGSRERPHQRGDAPARHRTSAASGSSAWGFSPSAPVCTRCRTGCSTWLRFPLPAVMVLMGAVPPRRERRLAAAGARVAHGSLRHAQGLRSSGHLPAHRNAAEDRDV